MIAIFVPLNIFGGNIGGIVNVMFPDLIIDVCLIIFFLFVIWKLFEKAIMQYKKESARFALIEEQKALVIAEVAIQNND